MQPYGYAPNDHICIFMSLYLNVNSSNNFFVCKQSARHLHTIKCIVDNAVKEMNINFTDIRRSHNHVLEMNKGSQAD